MTDIKRKKNTGEPGNKGQFGSKTHREDTTTLEERPPRLDPETASRNARHRYAQEMHRYMEETDEGRAVWEFIAHANEVAALEDKYLGGGHDSDEIMSLVVGTLEVESVDHPIVASYQEAKRRASLVEKEYLAWAAQPKPRSLSAVETGRVIKRTLRDQFPDTKFSVRGSRGTGYGYLHVSWEDGPTTEEVDEAVAPYKGSHFDGMQDMEVHHGPILLSVDGGEPEEVELGSRGVLTKRTFSNDAYRYAQERFVAAGYADVLDPDEPHTNRQHDVHSLDEFIIVDGISARDGRNEYERNSVALARRWLYQQSLPGRDAKK